MHLKSILLVPMLTTSTQTFTIHSQKRKKEPLFMI